MTLYPDIHARPRPAPTGPWVAGGDGVAHLALDDGTTGCGLRRPPQTFPHDRRCDVCGWLSERGGVI